MMLRIKLKRLIDFSIGYGYFLRKHWGKLIILLLVYASYKFIKLVEKEMENPSTEEVSETYPEIINQQYFLVGRDTMIVRTWSDNYQDTVYRTSD
jgi:hypothetical protein